MRYHAKRRLPEEDVCGLHICMQYKPHARRKEGTVGACRMPSSRRRSCSNGRSPRVCMHRGACSGTLAVGASHAYTLHRQPGFLQRTRHVRAHVLRKVPCRIPHLCGSGPAHACGAAPWTPPAGSAVQPPSGAVPANCTRIMMPAWKHLPLKTEASQQLIAASALVAAKAALYVRMFGQQKPPWNCMHSHF